MDSNSTSPLNILMWTITGILYMVSFLGNGFIMIVQGHQWLQKRKMLPYDFLLISLSTSRFMMHLQSLLNYYLYIAFSETCTGFYKEIIGYAIWLFFNLASLWADTWLSVFYCVKVTNFTSYLFLWLKPRINRLVPRLFGMSIVIFSIFSVPLVIDYLGQKCGGNLTIILLLNVSENESDKKNLFYVQLTYTSITFCTSVIASTLLLVSLWKHARNLKKSGLGGKDLNTQVHVNVIILLLSYVFLYLVYFTTLTLMVLDVIKGPIAEILVTSFPSAHSVILILTNPKLKAMAVHILNIRQRTS
ncbi:taste receptor type 2 member 8-like [Anolis sagrei]|uniref:taste receptor type 2 member 8-like n=1 Tax=Anolis sagrei TaxID=38937 RepID=UPI0035218F7B